MDRVVGIAHGTFEAKPVVCRLALGTAIVAGYDGTGVSILDRHGLGQDGNVIVPELVFHIYTALVADWTFV